MNKKIDNATETQIVTIYLCQMLGQPSAKEVFDVMIGKMEIKTSIVKVKNALNAAKKRGILSVNHKQSDDDEQLIDAYSMKDCRFSNPPEIAHIKNVLPALLDDEGSNEIFNMMEGTHNEGKTKGKSVPNIRDYVTYKCLFTNIIPVLGGEPFTTIESGEPTKATNKHRRVGEDIWIPGNLWLKAAIRNKLRFYNLTESLALYLYISDYFFKPKKALKQIICPSPPQRRGQQGTGLSTYEGLQSGEEFEFTLSFPIKGGISPTIMEDLLMGGIRIGAKHKDYGLLKLYSFDKIK